MNRRRRSGSDAARRVTRIDGGVPAVRRRAGARAVRGAFLTAVVVTAPACIVAADLAGKTCDARHACDGALFCNDGACVEDAPADAGLIDDDGGGPVVDDDGGPLVEDGGAPDGDAGALDAGPCGGAPCDGGLDGGGDGGAPGDGGDIGVADAGRPVVCGDGRVDVDESCDDGSTMDGDGCSAACALEPDAGTTCFGAPTVCAETAAVTWLCRDADAGCALAVPPVAAGDVFFVRAGTYQQQVNIDVNNIDVVVVGEPGAVLVGATGTELFEVHGAAPRLRLQGLTLAAVGAAIPLDIRQGATVVVDDCTIGPSGGVGVRQAADPDSSLTIRRSIVTGNLGGGLDLVGTALIESTFIIDNGIATSFGGVHVGGSAVRLAFVTVAGNHADESLGVGGVFCDADDGVVDVVASILWGNQGATDDVHDLCTTRESYVAGADPLFVAPALGDYHLAATTPLRDRQEAADVDAELVGAGVDGGAAGLGRDLDGDPRLLNAGYEPGADELPQ